LSSISVVIPAYNSSATLNAAVESARAQTHRPDEIVVVDDASRDETWAVLGTLTGRDLKPIRCAENRGGAAARNRGVAESSGDYIAFLDADDVWAPEKLALQLLALENAGPNAFCFSAVTQTNEYGERWTLPRRGPGPSESLADFVLKHGNIVQTSTLLVPRALCERCKFSESLRRFQDIDFVLQLERAGARPLFLDRPLVDWRDMKNPARVSTARDPALLAAFFDVHGSHLDAAQRLGLEVRSQPPSGGAREKLRWVRALGSSVALGAVPPQNALSLMLKYGLGTRRYAAVRQWVAR
jgi:glycosyltransferase involved in cell wall biosynthesis